MRRREGLVLTVCAFSLACQGALEAPPIEMAHRESLIGIGKIIQIQNSGTEALSGCSARIENPNGDVKNYSIGALGSGEGLEIGWKKLDGFQVDDQAEVGIRCEGFGLPVKATLAPSAPPTSS